MDPGVMRAGHQSLDKIVISVIGMNTTGHFANVRSDLVETSRPFIDNH